MWEVLMFPVPGRWESEWFGSREAAARWVAGRRPDFPTYLYAPDGSSERLT